MPQQSWDQQQMGGQPQQQQRFGSGGEGGGGGSQPYRPPARRQGGVTAGPRGGGGGGGGAGGGVWWWICGVRTDTEQQEASASPLGADSVERVHKHGCPAQQHGRLREQQQSRTPKSAQAPATHTYTAIGRVSSCFVERRGTPRQGCLVPGARAELKLSSRVVQSSPQDLSSSAQPPASWAMGVGCGGWVGYSRVGGSSGDGGS